MNKKLDTTKLVRISLAVVLNYVGSYLALILRLPIYLDMVGTIFISFIYGVKYGILTGFVTGLLAGITFDIYSLYFIPVQVIVGLIVGVYSKYDYFTLGLFKKIILLIFLSIASSLTGSIISAYVFEGITSSSSTYLVQIISNLGISKVKSIFIVQILTDSIDKLVSILLSRKLILALKNRRVLNE